MVDRVIEIKADEEVDDKVNENLGKIGSTLYNMVSVSMCCLFFAGLLSRSGAIALTEEWVATLERVVVELEGLNKETLSQSGDLQPQTNSIANVALEFGKLCQQGATVQETEQRGDPARINGYEANMKWVGKAMRDVLCALGQNPAKWDSYKRQNAKNEMNPTGGADE